MIKIYIFIFFKEFDISTSFYFMIKEEHNKN